MKGAATGEVPTTWLRHSDVKGLLWISKRQLAVYVRGWVLG